MGIGSPKGGGAFGRRRPVSALLRQIPIVFAPDSFVGHRMQYSRKVRVEWGVGDDLVNCRRTDDVSFEVANQRCSQSVMLGHVRHIG